MVRQYFHIKLGLYNRTFLKISPILWIYFGLVSYMRYEQTKSFSCEFASSCDIKKRSSKGKKKIETE